MKNAMNYHLMVRALRSFFLEKKGFIEVPAQSRLSILAAGEQPETIAQFALNNVLYPLPQTGQMCLEYELLNNPEWPGVFCVTTSYRDEPTSAEGCHWQIFPLFEFEAKGNFEALKQLEDELLLFLGFEVPVLIDYEQTRKKYETQSIGHEHENALCKELGTCISLEKYPASTHPFWNMKYAGNGLYNKIDIVLHGMETIESAERETDKQKMKDQFFSISHGKYAQLLFNRFSKERVLKELDEYLAFDMFERFGAGIGLHRLERAMVLSGLLEQQMPNVVPAHLFAPQIQL
jgi:hypothetical protein